MGNIKQGRIWKQVQYIDKLCLNFVPVDGAINWAGR
jgi:hypothetical protein